MNIYAFSSFSAFVLNALIGLFVYFKNRHGTNNRYFMYVTLALSAWVFGCFMESSVVSKHSALFWDRILYVGVALWPPFYIRFIHSFLNRRANKVLNVCWVISGIFLLFNFVSPLRYLLLSDVIKKYSFRFIGVPGPLWYLIVLYIVWSCMVGVVLSFIEFKNSTGHKRTRMKYFTIGQVLISSGGAMYFLLLLNIVTPPIDNFLVVVYSSIMAYAIIKHQLLEIEVIIKKTLVFAGLSASVVGIFVLATIFLQDVLGNFIGIPKIWTYIISAMLIVALVDPIKTFLINVTDKYLFQKKYDPAELIRTFSRVILTELDLDKIAKSTVDKLGEALKLTSCAILIPDKDGNKFIIKESLGLRDKKISFTKDASIVSYLSKVDSTILKGGEKPVSEPIIKDMDLVNATLCLGIMLHRQLIGILCLGKKKSDEEYTKDDVETLLLLSDALGVAVSNALAFEDVRQKEKLAAIGTLAAGIKHDIGTPLNQMSAFVQSFLIAREAGDHKKMPPEEVISNSYDLLTRCQMTFEKIAKISAKFADFARPKRKTELEPLNLTQSIEDALGVLEHEMQAANIVVKKDVQKDMPHIIADRDYMQQILFNIIKNANHAIQKANKSKEQSIISIVAKENSEHNVVIEIADTGIGIPEDGINKIFEPYYTTKEGEGGTGLGLAIVKELVERSNGKISVKSELGKGTTFVLEFPGVKA